MNVVIATDTAELTDAGNLTQLQVTAPEAASLESIDNILREGALGSVVDTHAYLDIEALRRRRVELGLIDDDAYDGMIEYAAKKGWVSDDGGAVRAHIERVG